MRGVALLGAVGVALAAPGWAAAADSTPPEIVVSVHGTQGAAGWYVGPVVVNWTVSDPESGFTVDSGCEPSTTIASDTGGASRSCQATSEGGTSSKSTRVRLDTTPPAVDAVRAARAPDAGDWFNHPVAVTWTGTDATSGIASCTSTTYAGPDAAAGSASGTCTDRAGNVSRPSAFSLRYDATPPAVTAVAAGRPPARSGWFTAPVDLVWSGTDATSGVASCTSLRFEGGAPPAGSCTDHAGNVSAPSAYGVRYDATPPRLAAVRARRRGSSAVITWRAQGGSVRVVRRPGRGGRASSVVYRGGATRFTDRGVRAGRRYVYAVIAEDPAGNARRARVAVGPRAWLVAPASGAVVERPVVLRWRAVPGARFYNVQLYRGATKILTTWPSKPRLVVPARLRPGTYTWYVWAARGPRSAPRYGRRLGRRTFVVR
jgi:hypothetical protein